MKMTPLILIAGSLMVFWFSTAIMVFMPVYTMDQKPSEIHRPMTEVEKQGHSLYVANGCSYCHTMFIRINDWGVGAERIAQRGDYADMEPWIVGTERTGPDLSQEGGLHPDDWHVAHFIEPRSTSPLSVMPNWTPLGPENIARLTAFVQYLGMRDADGRVSRQTYWKKQATAAWLAGPDENINWLHSRIPEVWRPMPNPYPADDASLLRGKTMYQQFCIGCHGPIGDGNGPAAKYLVPAPLNFTTLRRHLVENKYIGGIFYYQIMNGITGTAMPFFKKYLESAKIWDLANYVGVSFVGYTDANIPPQEIDASYEPYWKNPYQPPVMEGPDTGKPQSEKGQEK